MTKTLRPHQQEVLNLWTASCETRALLMHCVGAGKTLLSLLMLKAKGVDRCTVVGVPITRDAWLKEAELQGMEIEFVSHEKFRQEAYEPKYDSLLLDEIHRSTSMKSKVGTKKLLKIAPKMKYFIGMSATARWNSPERIYCVGKALWKDNPMWKGGYITFLYTYCNVKQNMFSRVPDFVSFKTSEDDMLSKLPFVHVLTDEELPIEDKEVNISMYNAERFEKIKRFSIFKGKVLTTLKSKEVLNELLLYGDVEKDLSGDNKFIQVCPAVLDAIIKEYSFGKKMLVYSNSEKIAKVFHDEVSKQIPSVIITGKTKVSDRKIALNKFLKEDARILFGTNALATGLDGIDRVCDKLIILNDTPDDCMRQQLIGRIRDRSGANDNSNKKIVRFKIGREEIPL